MINPLPEVHIGFLKIYLSIVLLVNCGWISARPTASIDRTVESKMHPTIQTYSNNKINARELTAEFWKSQAQDIILQKLRKENTNVAKNIIMFLGDGMSIPTLSATRAYMGGEEKQLSFETFPYTALSKTYCSDAQTADSACSATAYLSGIKNNMATIGVTAAVKLHDCDAMIQKENQVKSIAKWAQDAGKRTGIVTTSTITDASPTGTYAYIAHRNWQSDSDIKKAGLDATKCHDIAYQLIKGDTGKKFHVIMGGGSNKFLPKGTKDGLGVEGTRSDGVSLIDQWLKDRKAENNWAEYVWNRTGLLNVEGYTDYVLGLFSGDYMPYNLERDKTRTPSLEEMTQAAIKIASRGTGGQYGYFLFIEGGRIDHAHHATWAKKAFDETIEFSKAVDMAVKMTREEDTLIVVTSDHSHTMSISGYPDRFNDILGVAGKDNFKKPRLTINYANGPEAVKSGHDYGADKKDDKDYRFPGVSKLDSETHGGDDVGIFARGPWAHLFSGVLEQHTIPHIMAFASCIGEGRTACSGTLVILNPLVVLASMVLFYL